MYRVLLLCVVLFSHTVFAECHCQHKKKQNDNLCDFQSGYCLKESVKLKISPENAPSETWLTAQIVLPDNYRILKAHVEGRDMFMGYIPVQFDDDLVGRFRYGSCSSGYMVWKLVLKVQKDNLSSEIIEFEWLADVKNDI